MFFCGDFCNSGVDEHEFEVTHISPVVGSQRMNSEIHASEIRSAGGTFAMIKRSKYKDLLEECLRSNTRFVDKAFPANQSSLNFSIPNREITWRRISEIIPNCFMEENGIDPADIQQGNIGDCYFLASISALAENPQRIQNIFLDNFVVNGNCIYKVVACVDGVMAEVVIDDFVPVYASTSRPVFCKANGREIWVMLLEKAWAKIKGSYGAISAGTPHEVLNTFCLAPCFNFQIQSSNAEEYKDAVWAELLDASALDLPTCASTREEVLLEGLKPLHTYTVLSCANVPVGGINYRMMRLRNPWGDTEYSGFASESDSKFWSQVPKEIKAQMLPGESANDGDFVIPFSEFIKHFESIDTCHFRPQFSYEFETLKMARGQPTFVRLVVKEDHEAYLTLEKVYAGEDAQEELRHAGYGYSRMLIAREAGNQNFEYFSSKLETNFGDLSLRCNFQAGTYVIMVEADYPGGIPKFNAIFSYYYQGLQARESKTISVQSYDASVFLHQVLLNHAHRMSADVSKLSSRPEDWVKSTLLYEQGGYGYVACSLQKEANFRLHISIDENAIEQNGFKLVTQTATEVDVEAGTVSIFVFGMELKSGSVEQLSFPPGGFKISKVV